MVEVNREQHCHSLPNIAVWTQEWCHGMCSDGACMMQKGEEKKDYVK